MQIDPEDVDPVVNANAVLYLGERSDTVPAIRFIIETVQKKHARWSLYYEDRLALFYAVARAYRHSAPALSVLGNRIADEILERCHQSEKLTPLQAALAAAALLTFAPGSSAAGTLLRLILDSQRADGGWDAFAFYNVWGSEELTTALCLETLALSP
jgi:hypothetical protein